MRRISTAPGSILLATLLCGLSSAAEARRTVIDGNEYGTTYEVSTDVENGEGVSLPFAVNYGSGPQTDLIANFGPCCLGNPANEPPYVQVGLTFTNSPGDFLFATLLQEQFVDAGVRLSNDSETSTPLDPVDQASLFNFGMTTLLGGPPQVPGPGTGDLGFYSPFFGSASISFSDLSASGTPGDFGLQLICNGICTSIGFNLAGLNFSSALFDPANAPDQLESFEIGDGASSFNFVFRNSSAVPEPGTWLSMLLGFGLLGAMLRRHRRIRRAEAP